MTLLAMLFILRMVVKWGQKAEMISVQDIKEVLEVILPRNEITEEEILAIIWHQSEFGALRNYMPNYF